MLLPALITRSFPLGKLTEQIHRTHCSPRIKIIKPPSLPRKGVQASTTQGRTRTQPILTMRGQVLTIIVESFSDVSMESMDQNSTRPGHKGPIQYLARDIFIAASLGPGEIRGIWRSCHLGRVWAHMQWSTKGAGRQFADLFSMAFFALFYLSNADFISVAYS